MKLVLSVLLTGVVLLCCFGCGAPNMPPTAESNASASEHTISGGESEIPEDTESAQEATERDDVTTVESNESMVNGSENQEEAGGELTVEQNTFYVTIEDKRFAATFADTSGAQALKEMLADGPITIAMAALKRLGRLNRVYPLAMSRQPPRPEISCCIREIRSLSFMDPTPGVIHDWEKSTTLPAGQML